MGGILGGVMDGLFGGTATVATPDYRKAAEETAAGNLKNAQAATNANRYGTTNIAGTASWTQDPITGKWTQSSELSQPLQNNFNQASGNLGGMLGQDLTTSAGDPNLIQQNVTDSLYSQQTRYLDPQFEQSQASLENKLANQGITQGSEAYNNAMNNANMQKEQAYSNARNSAVGQGVSAAQGMFGMNLSNANLNNSSVNQGITNNMGVMNGMYGMTPQAGQYNQEAVAGPDYMGAMTGTYNADLGAANAQNASRNGLISGLAGMAGAAIAAPTGTFSGKKPAVPA